jgi:predicted enzyme related to lactoylglutathione lyase
MSTSVSTPTTVNNLGVAMFTVADQDAALGFYTQKLGWEVRADVSFGENGEHRWLEVAPPGSTARLALNSPMHDQPGGGSIGVETPDVHAELDRMTAAGIPIVTPIMDMGGAPPMFSIADPDGNHVWVVQTPAS